MKKASNTAPTLETETIPSDFSPTQEQIDTLARRLMPEIKRFFADKQIQQEFADWRRKLNSDSSEK